MMLIVAALLTAGCRRMGPAGGEAGDLVLRFATDVPATKANPSAGDQFNNLLVVVADMSDKPVDGKWAYKTFQEPVEQDEITFTDLPIGSYKVFAFANIDHTDWGHGIVQPADGSPEAIKNAVESLCVDGNIANGLDIDRTLSLPSPDTTPVPVYPASGGMFLSGQQEVFVGVKQNLGEVKLLRPVVRLKVLVRNHSGEPVTVNSVNLNGVNPAQTFLLGRETDGVPVIPPTTVGPLDMGFSGDTVPDNGELGKETLLFETASDLPYIILAEMKRGDDTRTIGSGSYRFKFHVEWDATGGKSLTVEHTNDAENIPEETSATVRWLAYKKGGDIIKIPFNNTSSSKPRVYDLVFDLEDCLSIFTDEGFWIREYYAAKDQTKYWGKKGTNQLTLGVPYNIQDPNSSAPQHSETWAPALLLDWDPEGAALKRIDPETHQATPIKYMRRNQELTVVLNVYYEIARGEFDITVENTEWGDDAHESNHIFR